MTELLTRFGETFAASGLVALAAAFVWGVLSVALSPCHLSSVPLVVAYMSGGEEFPTGRRAVWLSSAFAAGILASIALVGAATAAAGRMLGDVGRVGNWLVPLVFFAVGLNLLGVLPLPAFASAPASTGRRGAAGALLLGLVFGVALGPCTFAFMAPLLGIAFHASGTGGAAYGVLLVVLYGLGHAAAIALAGSSIQSVNRWLGWRNGARAVAVVKAVAGIAVCWAARTSSGPRCEQTGAEMGLPVIETPASAQACCAKPVATPVQPDEASSGRSIGRTVALLAAGLAVWTAAYLLVFPLSEHLTYRVLGLARESHLGQSVAFFLYDAPKVLLLLVLIVFGVGIIQSFFTAERTRALLAGKRESVGNVLAALLGVVTPFCSCSAVPLFLGFVEVGIPLGVTLSFLISAPMVNEVALVLLFGLFGWKIAAMYLATGLTVAIASGFILGRMKLEHFVEPWVFESMKANATYQSERLGFTGRVAKGLESVRDIVGKVWPWVLAGIAVGAGIHGYVPEGVLAGIMGKQAWWSVPAAVAIGVPMYSNAAGIIPIVEALLGKGAALGTVLAFMMAVIGLSLPEIVILRKVLRPRLIATFVGIVATGILMVGWLFNAVL